MTEWEREDDRRGQGALQSTESARELLHCTAQQPAQVVQGSVGENSSELPFAGLDKFFGSLCSSIVPM